MYVYTGIRADIRIYGNPYTEICVKLYMYTYVRTGVCLGVIATPMLIYTCIY